jgi:hypothetical protein
MEEYTGRHRKPEIDQASYYMNELGFRLMIKSANLDSNGRHTSEYPIVRHSLPKVKKYKARHSYNSKIQWFLLKIGLDGFGKMNPATNYM